MFLCRDAKLYDAVFLLASLDLPRPSTASANGMRIPIFETSFFKSSGYGISARSVRTAGLERVPPAKEPSREDPRRKAALSGEPFSRSCDVDNAEPETLEFVASAIFLCKVSCSSLSACAAAAHLRHMPMFAIVTPAIAHAKRTPKHWACMGLQPCVQTSTRRLYVLYAGSATPQW